MQKRLWIIIAALVILGGLVLWKLHSQSGPAHPWATFTNTTLGFSLEYPSGTLTPEAGATTGTTSIVLDGTNTTTPNSDEIRISTENTDAKDIDAYLQTIQTPFPPTHLTIGGLPGREFDEMAYADYTIYALRDGKVYILVINLPPSEAARVKSSFSFK